MKPMPSPVRAYNVPDARMAAAGSFVNSKFVVDWKAFHTFAPSDFPEDYGKNLDEAVAEILALPGDEMVRLELGKYTQRALAADTLVRNDIFKFRFFINRHVEGDLAVKQLGIGTFSRIVTNSDTLILFMTRFNPAVLEYKAELVAAGCPEKLFVDVVKHTVELIDSRNAQTSYIARRQDLTIQRVKKMNILWGMMVEIVAADKVMAQVVPAWKESYVLPYPLPTDPKTRAKSRKTDAPEKGTTPESKTDNLPTK